jgi:hypothetical protein
MPHLVSVEITFPPALSLRGIRPRPQPAGAAEKQIQLTGNSQGENMAETLPKGP